MINEVIKYLGCKENENYIDATFGAGGYSKAILENAKCNIIAIDRDDNVKKFANILSAKYGSRFKFFNNKFSEISSIAKISNISKFDGIIYDFGVSSMQLDDKDRGFSFDSNKKLDMRMNKDNPISAYEVVNNMKEDELFHIIKTYGEERRAKLIAKKIVESRAIKEITYCNELADIIRKIYKGYHKIDPATKTFQAIRIYVNNELQEIKESLIQSLSILKKGGRIITVSFHSLEDVIVKKFFKEEAGQDVTYSRYEPVLRDEKNVKLKIVTKSAIKPSDQEVKDNKRSRSSRLRVAIKI
ncbi:MAG: 16S rRNA (cytosine(1402)-N(4))-methyltransferase [Rickettsiales bacterium]|jgi:16S rRNA (cytosine1402-N4)-methyltransferase|nr:16S rRNA (cytosine(1402)-N(4))-methyltransferase [Rickettsiales bacterium]|tara:strand:- start:6876 stop:7775 length:900 start_codon:yes stop_codon:yes gene_type:complete